ncbi:DNA-directed RNA polymerase specialized sigma24 family protein [Afipia massiliensis]|uniref:DNA-directed RNA polymerase specialized sigma24 family protein n=1 Tax=Afipia massiliensis TaxID=211460 RepID=A0A840MZW4_9BRAD|nr:sigma factor-like helix-turn-helix DNA-binding protein [Afipia massiliensis]MBB5051151.1 DNA-directed RNA polymerase specialized sigma24 family protein [Afipia massiliensis]
MKGLTATDAELEQLPRNAQDILSLACLGLNYLSIAATLSVPLGTVRSRLHRARARVAAMRAAQAVR